jgi:hypothetical protein
MLGGVDLRWLAASLCRCELAEDPVRPGDIVMPQILGQHPAFVESMLAGMAGAPDEGGSASVAQMFADRLEREPALAGYVRRLLCDGGPAGVALFGRLYQATRAGMQALEQAGVVRPSRDGPVRDAFLLGNDLAMVLLRPHISQVLGIDPLARDGLVRWSAEVFEVYAHGVFAPATPPQAAELPPAADQGGRTGEKRHRDLRADEALRQRRRGE